MATTPEIVPPSPLRRCWHPVGYSRELPRAPRATTLLDEPLVLWRDSAGAAHAFRDVCVHRGTALSLGAVEGDEIVCAYHGWR
jgi:phenylpropionate dioxygenase-like ring-hydroxylating dioxygenase large terminal subunit